ncbi:HEPN domain-containing protein [Thauera aminoaromatica]|uniref:RiboL-PSP-HEPN domain-containing protein n=1 Tax=Thauera aminoaromatica TaxID=164330 RepID=A0A5C7SM62_THASP|nr:HEPN domain-containing protein [Thauera aminoaromatica]TXH84720.1 MAG: hypothetical protein E6Q80_10940 [Thauera aminoaromatica]
MAYANHFRHADDVIAHLNTVVPTITDPLLVAKYSGFAAVAAVTVYELAIKEIFCEFGRRKHKILGNFTESYFDRINGRITLKNIKDDYCLRFGDAYASKFKNRLDTAARRYLIAHRRDARSSYGNLIVWRNDFAHEGRTPATATYAEVVQSYEDGKLVIHTLASSMVR